MASPDAQPPARRWVGLQALQSSASLRRLINSLPAEEPETSQEGWRNARTLCTKLHADTTQVRDICTALVLSECIYKRPDSDCSQKLADFKSEFAPGLVVFQACCAFRAFSTQKSESIFNHLQK